jgi:hypothetical protein
MEKVQRRLRLIDGGNVRETHGRVQDKVRPAHIFAVPLLSEDQARRSPLRQSPPVASGPVRPDNVYNQKGCAGGQYE